MLISGGVAGAGYLGLREAKFKKWQAALISVTATIGFGLLKESFIDDFYDKQDMEANIVGAGIGVLIPIVFTF